ncbi:virulence RhuM family protein [Pseudidiomarina salilacus]|uniref:virulence RhuM family protein n=1 Tax=Pseudidiomarina salilacus TaxID=3384452 RepID=UPI0039846C63
MADNDLILYTSEDGEARLTLRELGGQVWLTQLEMAELYQTTKQNISLHVQNILDEGELSAEATVKENLTVQTEGTRDVKRSIQLYALPMIIAVGYRVRSTRGTQFRKWATQTLGEYLTKGFVMDDERLKNPPVGTSTAPDYFDELLERIRDIRASERRMYLRVREIFTLAADYEPSLRETTEFFKVIQNKLHFATTGLTAAELIHSRADANKPNMGLTAFKGDQVRKGDITTAKNYLNEAEIKQLNRIVTMWLDYAEDQATRRKQVFLKDWVSKLDDFLSFNERDVLQNAGPMSKDEADQKAQTEFDKYTAQQRQLKEQKGADSLAELLKARDRIKSSKGE